MYIKGDRQHNSYTLTNEVVNTLMIMDNNQITSELLKSLLVFYCSFLDNEKLDEQIERLELFKSGKVDTPIEVKFGR